MPTLQNSQEGFSASERLADISDNDLTAIESEIVSDYDHIGDNGSSKLVRHAKKILSKANLSRSSTGSYRKKSLALSPRWRCSPASASCLYRSILCLRPDFFKNILNQHQDRKLLINCPIRECCDYLSDYLDLVSFEIYLMLMRKCNTRLFYHWLFGFQPFLQKKNHRKRFRRTVR